MRPKGPIEDRDEDLFRSHLANILDQRHELLHLAAPIDWAALDATFGPHGDQRPVARHGAPDGWGVR